jgi:hypothetical protein
MEVIGEIALYIGVGDASALLLMGVVSAALFLFDIDGADFFWKRLWPAVGILLATSVAAVLILLATRWIASILT